MKKTVRAVKPYYPLRGWLSLWHDFFGHPEDALVDFREYKARPAQLGLAAFPRKVYVTCAKCGMFFQLSSDYVIPTLKALCDCSDCPKCAVREGRLLNSVCRKCGKCTGCQEHTQGCVGCSADPEMRKIKE